MSADENLIYFSIDSITPDVSIDTTQNLAIGLKEFREPFANRITSEKYTNSQYFELRKATRKGNLGKGVATSRLIKKQMSKFLEDKNVVCYGYEDRVEMNRVSSFLSVIVDSLKIVYLEKADNKSNIVGKMEVSVQIEYIIMSIENEELYRSTFVCTTEVEDIRDYFTVQAQAEVFKKALFCTNEKFFNEPMVQELMKNSERDFDRKYDAFVIQKKPLNAKPDIAIPSIQYDRYATKMSEVSDGFVVVESATNRGSGVAISNDGYILSSFELVDYNDSVKVKLKNNIERTGRVLRSSMKYGVVLIKVDSVNLTAVRLKSGLPELADEIYSTGSLNFEVENFSLAKGIISGIRKSEEGETRVQFDAPLNDTGLGAPLLNLNAEIIGIINGRVYDISTEGLGFATCVDDLLEGLGLQLQE